MNQSYTFLAALGLLVSNVSAANWQSWRGLKGTVVAWFIKFTNRRRLEVIL